MRRRDFVAGVGGAAMWARTRPAWHVLRECRDYHYRPGPRNAAGQVPVQFLFLLVRVLGGFLRRHWCSVPFRSLDRQGTFYYHPLCDVLSTFLSDTSEKGLTL